MKTIFSDKFRGPIAVKVVGPLILMAAAAAFLTNPLAFANSDRSSNLTISNVANPSKALKPNQAIVKIAKVQVTAPKLTTVSALTNLKGFVLYYYDLDKDPKKPNCSKITKAPCAVEWPPLLLPQGGSLTVPGLTVKLTVIKNDNGQQVAYNNRLLYGYEFDTKALVATGNLRGSKNWHVAIAIAAHQPIKLSPSGGQQTVRGVPTK